jgi:hypothetical protein
MKYPKRPSKHIKETESWKILQNSVPSEWIVRGVSERDYGVDCYIEMVGNDGSVTGDLLSVQLKGTELLDWKHNDRQNRDEARFSGIKIETISHHTPDGHPKCTTCGHFKMPHPSRVIFQ